MNAQRTLGLFGMITSPLLLLYLLTDQPTAGAEFSLLGSILGLIFQVGCLATVGGLLLSGAAGNGRVSRSLLVVQMVLHTLAAIFQIREYLYPANATDGLWVITDIAWPLGFLWMFVTGTVVLRARRWAGWRRFAPLLCGLPLPLSILISSVAGEGVMVYTFGVGLLLTYLFLGFAVFSYNNEERVEALTTQPSFS
jgi:hypothetical protein